MEPFGTKAKKNFGVLNDTFKNMRYNSLMTLLKQVIRVKKTRGAATPRTRITCELFGKPKNAVCI